MLSYTIADMQNNPYSTWVIPLSPLLDELQGDIIAMSSECNTPAFPAHFTLIPDALGVEKKIVAAITKAAKNLKPLTVSFSAVGFSSTDYFKSLYLHIIPSQTLVDMRNELFAALQLEVTPFMPHFSLLYSDHKTNEIKYELRKKYRLERYIGKTWKADRLFVYLTRQKDVRTDGWKQIAEIPLAGSP